MIPSNAITLKWNFNDQSNNSPIKLNVSTRRSRELKWGHSIADNKYHQVRFNMPASNKRRYLLDGVSLPPFFKAFFLAGEVTLWIPDKLLDTMFLIIFLLFFYRIFYI